MSKVLATQIRDFAVNPASQSLIIGDASMLNTLVQFLATTNEPETIIASLEAFQALSKNQTHRQTVLALPGILIKLADLCDYDADPAYGSQISSISKQTLDNLQSLVNTPAPKIDRDATRLPPVAACKAGAFGVRGYLYPLALSIPDMVNEAARSRVESSLIATKGVVSLTIDMGTKVATLYCSQKAADMQARCIEALSAGGFKASVSSGAADKENAVNSSTSGAGDRPGYLTKSSTGKDALVRYVDKNEKKKPTQASGGWLGGITSYFW